MRGRGCGLEVVGSEGLHADPHSLRIQTLVFTGLSQDLFGLRGR